MHIEIVVPCLNEELNIPLWGPVLNHLNEQASTFTTPVLLTLCFVDDGSIDNTWAAIRLLYYERSSQVAGIRLSRNFGHQSALMAGLLASKADAVITIDADFQDDLDAIMAMIQHHIDGKDVVFGVRDSRLSDSIFKRFSAELYYLILRISQINVVPHHADFRLLSRRAIEMLRLFQERNLFLRGIIPTIGLPSAKVYYDRKPRNKGESKYGLWRMLNLGMDGITSFSISPLRAVTITGLVVFLLSLSLMAWAFFIRATDNSAVPGWASILIPLAFFSGIQILSIGIIGEYLGKIFNEVKRRPLFFAEQSLGGIASAEELNRKNFSSSQ